MHFTLDELAIGVVAALEKSGLSFDWNVRGYMTEQRLRDKLAADWYYTKHVSLDETNDDDEGMGESAWLSDEMQAEKTGGTTGVDRIVDAADGKTAEWRRRYRAAEARVMRRAPECLATFRGIVRNGSNREATIAELATAYSHGGSTTGSCRSCASCSA